MESTRERLPGEYPDPRHDTPGGWPKIDIHLRCIVNPKLWQTAQQRREIVQKLALRAVEKYLTQVEAQDGATAGVEVSPA